MLSKNFKKKLKRFLLRHYPKLNWKWFTSMQKKKIKIGAAKKATKIHEKDWNFDIKLAKKVMIYSGIWFAMVCHEVLFGLAVLWFQYVTV